MRLSLFVTVSICLALSLLDLVPRAASEVCQNHYQTCSKYCCIGPGSPWYFVCCDNCKLSWNKDACKDDDDDDDDHSRTSMSTTTILIIVFIVIALLLGALIVTLLLLYRRKKIKKSIIIKSTLERPPQGYGTSSLPAPGAISCPSNAPPNYSEAGPPYLAPPPPYAAFKGDDFNSGRNDAPQ